VDRLDDRTDSRGALPVSVREHADHVVTECRPVVGRAIPKSYGVYLRGQVRAGHRTVLSGGSGLGCQHGVQMRMTHGRSLLFTSPGNMTVLT
jgi:hypothetical protein